MNKSIPQPLVLLIAVTLLLIGGIVYGYVYDGKTAGVQTQAVERTIGGIIVPHHLFAAELIDEAYQKVPAGDIQHIIILSPNHFYPDLPDIVSSFTVEGVSVDRGLIQGLMKKFPSLTVNDGMVRHEHGITSQIAFIKRYIPGVPVVPIVISAAATQEDIGKLAQALSSEIPQDGTMFVLSTDFSHNTTTVEGLAKNIETIDAIRSFNYERIASFSDDHIDAPNAAIVFLTVLNSLGFRNWELWQSSHSGLIAGDAGNQGTSYVTGGFYNP